MNTCFIIYNPAAGQGSAAERLTAVTAELERHSIPFELALTGGRGEAIELAYRAAGRSDLRTVVAAGGDGTVNEVLNGLMRARAEGRPVPPLGVICIGRGNDFAYGAGIPTDCPGSIANLVSGAPVWMDVGYLRGGVFPEGRYFGNGIGIGFDTIVGFEAARMKRVKGFSAYVLGAIKALLFYYRAPLLRLTTDEGVVERPAIQVSVMNGRRMGGAFLMAPRAEPADGLLDLCIAGTPRRGAMLALIVRYLKGTQDGHPHITMSRTRRFGVISEDGGIAVHADGETVSVDDATLEVECIPGALEVVCATTPAREEASADAVSRDAEPRLAAPPDRDADTVDGPV